MKRKNFTMIDNKMLTDKRLAKHESRLVWQGFKMHCNNKMQCYPKIQTVADELGLPVIKVKRAIKLLQELGYMSWNRSRGASYYTLYYEPRSIPLIPQKYPLDTSEVSQGATEPYPKNQKDLKEVKKQVKNGVPFETTAKNAVVSDSANREHLTDFDKRLAEASRYARQQLRSKPS